MGSCGKALPAYPTIPTRSPPREFMICETNCLDFSSLFGAISSESMLFETSIAKTMSTPSLFTSSNFVPILGLTKAITIKNKANSINTSFKTGLKVDRAGLNLERASLFANLFCALFFHTCKIKNINNTRGMSPSK